MFNKSQYVYRLPPVQLALIVIVGLPILILANPAKADFLVSSRFSNEIIRYDENTGDFIDVFATGPELINPNGIAFGADNHLYVGLGDGGGVLRYDGVTGAFLGQFVEAGAGGLGGIRDLLFGPDGDLYVASGTTDQVLRYDGTTGEFLSVAAMGNGLDGPVGLAFDEQGSLFVAGALSNRVFQFTDGAFQRSFNGGPTHRNSVGLAFNADGNLLVSQSVTNEILSFDPSTGEFLEVFANGPAGIPIYMEERNGELFVGAFGTDSVWRFDSITGDVIDQFVLPGTGGLDGTHDFAFTPNAVPEPSCMLIVFGAGAWLAISRNRKSF